MDSHGGVRLRLGRRPGGEEAGQEGYRSQGWGHELGYPARPSWRWQGSGKRSWSVWWCWCGGHGIWRLGVKRGRCQSSAGTSARNAVALPCKEEETGIKPPGRGTKARCWPHRKCPYPEQSSEWPVLGLPAPHLALRVQTAAHPPILGGGQC